MTDRHGIDQPADHLPFVALVVMEAATAGAEPLYQENFVLCTLRTRHPPARGSCGGPGTRRPAT